MQNNSIQTNSPQQQADRYSIGKSSEYLGVSIDTLRRWEKKGVIPAYRSPGGHRYFLKSDLDKLFGQKYVRAVPSKPRKSRPEPVPEPVKEPETPEKPQTISQDITSTPQPPVQAVREEPAPITQQEKVSEAIQQRQDLEIKARELIRTPSPTSAPTPEKKESIKINFGEIPWSKILIIGIVLFVIADLILLTVYLTSSRPLVSPIP